MSSQKWSTEQIETLIEAYKLERNLYEVKSQNYHNRNMRADSLAKVLSAVSRVKPGVTVNDITSKFHSLRNNYTSELKKVNLSIKSGTGTDDIYQPALWYFKLMEFLKDHFVPRKSISSGISTELSNSYASSTPPVSASSTPPASASSTPPASASSTPPASAHSTPRLSLENPRALTSHEGQAVSEVSIGHREDSSEVIEMSQCSESLLAIDHGYFVIGEDDSQFSFPDVHTQQAREGSPEKSVCPPARALTPLPGPSSGSTVSDSTPILTSVAARKRRRLSVPDTDEDLDKLVSALNKPVPISVASTQPPRTRWICAWTSWGR